MADEQPTILAWRRLDHLELPVMLVVVDDTGDDELASAIAEDAAEGALYSGRFGGAWGAGPRVSGPTIVFGIVEPGGGLERHWWTRVDAKLLQAIVHVPHLAAVMPREIAGDDLPNLDENAAAARLAGSLVVPVELVSPNIRQLHAMAKRGP